MVACCTLQSWRCARPEAVSVSLHCLAPDSFIAGALELPPGPAEKLGGADVEGSSSRDGPCNSYVLDSAMRAPCKSTSRTHRAACRPIQETWLAEVAGPLPGDGFMGESPAPRRGALMQTPMQDRQQRNSNQVSRVHDRPAPGW